MISRRRQKSGYSELISNCPGSFLIALAVVLVVLVVGLVVLGVVFLAPVAVVASHYCYRCKKNHPQDHQNHYQDHQNHRQDS